MSVVLTFAALVGARPSVADPVKAELTASDNGGYARLVFSMSDYDDAQVRQAGTILIIGFRSPLAVSVERLAVQAPEYIGGARRDPDGKAIRLALKRDVTVHTMTAGEKLFVDLLPDTWHGPPPALPQDVVDALARRAREAEKLAARERRLASLQDIPPVHVRVATQPTFTRYVFGVPQQIAVAADRGKDGLTLNFDAPVKFDLGDAVAALPPAVTSIEPQLGDQSTTVHFMLAAKADVRTFRDESGYVVDIVGARSAQNGAAALPLGQGTQPLPAPMASPPPPPAAAAALPAPAAAPAKNISPKPSPAASVANPPAAAAAPSPAAAPPSKPVPAPARNAKIPADAAKAAPPPAVPQPRPAATANAAANFEIIAQLAAAAAAVAQPQAGASTGKIPVELVRQGANLKLSFDFLTPTAAAVFHRADSLWIVFDAKTDIDLSALRDEASHTIRSAELTRAPDADIVRIRLDRPQLSSVSADGPAWLLEIGDSVQAPTHALDLSRNVIGANRSRISIGLDAPHALHRLSDPEAGDQLIVVTAFPPARGLIHDQDFVEFHALSSDQGVVIEPLADDINVALAPDRVVVSRPTGLLLSNSLQSLLRGNSLRPLTFDAQLWGFDRNASYVQRQSQLIAAAAAAPDNKRVRLRLDLARFYLAREMFPEAKGVLDVVLGQKRPTAEDISAIVLRAVAEIMMNRPEAALKDLADPAVGDQHDAPLWRALAYARQGRWGDARAGFKKADAAVATLPIELQRAALKDEMLASIAVADFADAENQLNDLETIGVPRDMQPGLAVLIGRLEEGMGRTEDALGAYRTAADSWDRPAAAQGRLRETELRYRLGDLKRDDVVSDLESLTTIWRGDETEIEALKVLAQLYTEDGRYRDSFYVMRSAMTAHPDWDMTRKIQEEAAKTFDSLFLAGKGDTLSAIDALALFYDFRELTPIGSRGDEMIRRLADRLVSVDLLDQATDLLQYQVDKRLQGAARAEVATRLAVIYLMNRKPDRALATLRATRLADLSADLRKQRLLLEARAFSDLGRHALALEVVAAMDGPEAIRLRSDIHWASRQWRQSAEQIELMYGERWKQWQPLTDVERADVLRAEIGYALAEDKIGLARFREKYAPKMAGTPDARAFEIVSAPLGTAGQDFKDIAHAAAAVDTLDDFLRDMKARYRESNPISMAPAVPQAQAPAVKPAAKNTAAPPAAAPQTRPAVSATPPVPAAPAAPRTAAPGRTALR